MMPAVSSLIFRALLIVVGLFTVLIGINVGFGGILTLGLQGQVSFLEVTNQPAFLVRDSHIRYFGGLYGGVGLFLILATTNLAKYRSALNLVFALIFLGGLARFTMLQPSVVFGPDILPSLIAELVLMPLLFVWLPKLVAMPRPATALAAQPAMREA